MRVQALRVCSVVLAELAYEVDGGADAGEGKDCGCYAGYGGFSVDGEDCGDDEHEGKEHDRTREGEGVVVETVPVVGGLAHDVAFFLLGRFPLMFIV